MRHISSSLPVATANKDIASTLNISCGCVCWVRTGWNLRWRSMGWCTSTILAFSLRLFELLTALHRACHSATPVSAPAIPCRHFRYTSVRHLLLGCVFHSQREISIRHLTKRRNSIACVPTNWVLEAVDYLAQVNVERDVSSSLRAAARRHPRLNASWNLRISQLGYKPGWA